MRKEQAITMKKQWALLGMALTVGLAVSAAVFAVSVYSNEIQGEIAGEVIRFHVLANSDDPVDQTLKFLVRDGILERLNSQLVAYDTIEETRLALTGLLPEIEEWAREIIKSQGRDDDVSAVLTNGYFPTRTYDNLSLPAGVYETLRLTIGSGGGHNWWCVMFPPLCFVDAAVSETVSEDAGQLSALLTAESYGIVTGGNVKVKFKVVELWQEFKQFVKGLGGGN